MEYVYGSQGHEHYWYSATHLVWTRRVLAVDTACDAKAASFLTDGDGRRS